MKATLKLSEKIVTEQIVSMMRAHGWRAIRLQSGLFSRPLSQARVRIGEAGMPDYLFLRPLISMTGVAQCVFVEIKTQDGKRTPQQMLWAAEAVSKGFDMICAYGFEDFEAAYKSRFSQ